MFAWCGLDPFPFPHLRSGPTAPLHHIDSPDSSCRPAPFRSTQTPRSEARSPD